MLMALPACCGLFFFDKRRMGLSDRSAEIAPLEVRIDDMLAVMDAACSSWAAFQHFRGRCDVYLVCGHVSRAHRCTRAHNRVNSS
jgi:hypothetical protein